jgi:hypothetical protein
MLFCWGKKFVFHVPVKTGGKVYHLTMQVIVVFVDCLLEKAIVVGCYMPVLVEN